MHCGVQGRAVGRHSAQRLPNAQPPQVRSDGAGGAYLLYTTRENVMYTLPFSELLRRVVRVAPAEPAGAQFPRNRGVGAGKQENHYTAMHAAMR